MKTWLLSWNQNNFRWDHYLYGYDALRASIKQTGHAYYLWSCGNNKSIEEGDRIFLIKLGSEPRGIVASGYAVSTVFESPHWDSNLREMGKTAKRIYIDFDEIKDFEHNELLPYGILTEIDDKYHWSIQASGVRVPEATAKLVEDSWNNM